MKKIDKNMKDQPETKLISMSIGNGHQVLSFLHVVKDINTLDKTTIGNGEYITYNHVFEKIAEQVHTTPKQSTRKYKFKNTSL